VNDVINEIMEDYKKKLQDLANVDGIKVTGRITLTYDILAEYDLDEKRLKDWFDNYPITIRVYGHAARENLAIGNSGKLVNMELFFNEKKK